MINNKKQSNLFDQIKSHGNQIAIYDQNIAYSFKYLLDKSHALAMYFKESGLKSNDKIYIHLENQIETVLSYLACWILGAISCPLNYRLKKDEVKHVFDQLKPNLFITDNEKYEQLKPLSLNFKIMKASEISDVLERNYINIDKNYYEYSDDQIASIHFTSGTMGFHKAVAHSFKQINEYTEHCVLDMEYQINDRLIISLSLMHAFSFSYQLLPALWLGTPCILIKKFDEKNIIEQMIQHKATSISLLPAHCYYLSLYAEKNNKKVPTLNDCLSAGDALPLAICQKFEAIFNGVKPRQGLGMTECFGYTINPKNNNKIETAGKALINTEIKIRPLNSYDCTSGEIMIRSDGNMLGLYSDEKGLFSKPESNWVSSGDLGSIDEHGYLHFKGRLRQIIIRDGSNIMPLEVENVLYRHESILEAAVCGIKDEIHGETVKAFVVLSETNLVNEEEVKAFCKEYLADYKVPESIEFLDSLPKNATGKIDRDKLAKKEMQKQQKVAFV